MRILVVEDETELRESLRQQLADTGFSVEVAGDGEEGLFAGLNYALDAAIVDIGLPKRSGIDVIREWRKRERTMPVWHACGASCAEPADGPRRSSYAGRS